MAKSSDALKRKTAAAMVRYRAAKKARLAARRAAAAGIKLPSEAAAVEDWLRRNEPTKCAPAFLLPTQSAR